MKLSDLKTLSFDDLVAVRDSATKLIAKQADKQRQMLEAQLAKLGGMMDGGTGKRRGRPPGRRGPLAGTKAIPKYRNPANKSETWAGRGLMPRWMTAAIKDGKKAEDFLIVRGKRGPKTGSKRKGAAA